MAESDSDQKAQIISASELQLADIIVTRANSPQSVFIRAATWSGVSHASLYVGNGEVVEAVASGVRKVPVITATQHDTQAIVYRHVSISSDKAHLIVRFALSRMDKPYDFGGALGGGMRESPNLCKTVAHSLSNPILKLSAIVACEAGAQGKFNSTDSYYCSELVLEAFRQANLPLANHNPNVSTPKDVLTAYGVGTLMYVGHLKD